MAVTTAEFAAGRGIGGVSLRERALLAVASGALWLALLAAARWAPEGIYAHAAFRGLLLALVLWMGSALIYSDARLLLLSPLYLLGVANLVFFSLLPWAFALFIGTGYDWGNMDTLTVQGVGGLAETLILQFSAFCLFAFALLLLLLRGIDRPGEAAAARGRGGSAGAFIVIALATVAVGAAMIAMRRVPAAAAFAANGIGHQIHDGLLPWLSVGLAALAWLGTTGGLATAFAAAVLIVAGLAAALLSQLAETPLYMAFAAFALMGLAAPSVRRRRIFAFLVPVLVAGAIGGGLLATFWMRPDTSPPPRTSQIADVAIRKVFLRQGVPMGCLQNIATRPGAWRTNGDPFYFVVGLVPKALWPDKPSLSLGSEYAARYCGNPAALKTGHSESITLLGEPIIRDGWRGLAVAELVLAAALGVATVIGLSGGTIRLIGFVALLPWLIAFTQHYELYIANAVKMLLYMLPPLIALWFLFRARRRAP